MKKPWPETNRCASRLFCRSCRTDPAWRQTLVALGRVAERDFACPHGVTAESLPAPRPAGGPGTELKRLLARAHIRVTPGCRCTPMALQMDREGPDWCRTHVPEILAVMREEAQRRKLPFLAVIGRKLIKLAILRAERLTLKHSTPR